MSDDLQVSATQGEEGRPQITVELLVDCHGFPLQVGCWGNKAETTTIIPVVEAFQCRPRH